MTFSNLCNEIFWKSTTDYHVTDSVDAPMNNPYELKTIEYYLYLRTGLMLCNGILRILSVTRRLIR